MARAIKMWNELGSLTLIEVRGIGVISYTDLGVKCAGKLFPRRNGAKSSSHGSENPWMASVKRQFLLRVNAMRAVT